MKPEEYEIQDLIPQRPPMVMIHRLTDAGDSYARGRLFIETSNLFCRDGCLQEAGMIEFITQTAAAWKGYLRLSEQKEVKQGFLTSIKNLVINSLPVAGTEIQSEIVIEEEILGYTIITGKVIYNNNVIAEGEMRIMTET